MPIIAISKSFLARFSFFPPKSLAALSRAELTHNESKRERGRAESGEWWRKGAGPTINFAHLLLSYPFFMAISARTHAHTHTHIHTEHFVFPKWSKQAD